MRVRESADRQVSLAPRIIFRVTVTVVSFLAETPYEIFGPKSRDNTRWPRDLSANVLQPSTPSDNDFGPDAKIPRIVFAGFGPIAR